MTTLPAPTELQQLDGVFVLGEPATRMQTITACLEAGRKVVTDSPISPSADDVATFDADSLFVLRKGFEEPDFRRAAQVVAIGEAGVVRHAEFVLQQMGAFYLPEDPLAPDPKNSPSPAELSHGVLTAFGPDLLAQTLTLIPQRVTRVVGVRSYVRPDFGPVDVSPGISRVSSRPAEIDTGFRVWLEFDGGATAHVCVDLAAHADVATGWILQTDRGGYRNSRQVLTEADGEIYDVPIEPDEGTLIDRVFEFLSPVTREESGSGGRLTDALFSARTELRVLRLLETIRQSDEMKQSVTVSI
jgi:predicted dehydrogenase